MDEPTQERLRAALATWAPKRIPLLGPRAPVAAVAVVVAPRPEGMSLLLIRRPDRSGDRWSGHIAFPGGLVGPGDPDSASAAAREANEEVGLVLGPPIGRLSELLTAAPGRARPMRVVPHVFAANGDETLAPDPREVDEAFWIPITELSERKPEKTIRRIKGVPVPISGLTLEHGFLWGLTWSMVRELLRLLR